MTLDIRANSIALDEGLRRHVERRLRFALGRFAGRLGRVAVRLADENGPRGGRDKRCRIVLRLGRTGTVTIEERGDDVQAAVAVAAERAGRVVARAVRRAVA